jgi:hypothetical protein
MTQVVVSEGRWLLSEINFSLHYFTIMLPTALELFMTDVLYHRQQRTTAARCEFEVCFVRKHYLYLLNELARSTSHVNCADGTNGTRVISVKSNSLGWHSTVRQKACGMESRLPF